MVKVKRQNVESESTDFAPRILDPRGLPALGKDSFATL